MEGFKAIFRLGKIKDDNSPRPLIIQFREKTMKNQVMESVFKLKDAEDKFKNINISHDYTKDDRGNSSGG